MFIVESKSLILLWKWKLETEMENRNGQNLMQMNVRVKPLIIYPAPIILRSPLCKDHTVIQ